MEDGFSMDTNKGDEAAPVARAPTRDLDRMTEEEQIAYAMQMSMADMLGEEQDKGESMDVDDKDADYSEVMNDLAFQQLNLQNLPGVDPQSDAICSAMGSVKDDKEKKDEEKTTLPYRFYHLKMACSYEEALPVEQWQQILAKASAGDLCKVAMASRHMNNLAGRPDLWKGMKVNMRMIKKYGLAQFYSIKRYEKVKKLNFTNMSFTPEELERILNDIPRSPVENINFSYVNLQRIPAHILAEAISCLHTVNLGDTNLTTFQCNKVLEASLSSTPLDTGQDVFAPSWLRLGSQLRDPTSWTPTLANVDFRNINLKKVNADLLARAVSRLHTVNLSANAYINGIRLTSDQCVKILEASLSSNTLVNINLNNVSLWEVNAELLASAVARLQTIELSRTHLTAEQCVQLIKAIISSTTLVNVNLNSNHLCHVDADLLANAISRLQTIKLSGTGLTPEQCIKVVEACISSKTLVNVSLVMLNLRGKVPAELLAALQEDISIFKVY